MSSRPQAEPHAVIFNGDMSSDIISTPTIIQKLSMISFDASWSGTSPVGEIIVQVSNTYSINSDGTVKNPGSWTTIPISDPATVTGNTGNGFIDIDELGAYAIRVVYTATSGTGTLNVLICAKVA